MQQAMIPSGSAWQPAQFRSFASSAATASGQEKPAAEASSSSQAEASSSSGANAEASSNGAQSLPSAEELAAQLQAKEAANAKLQEQVDKLTDSLKRTLAEQENLRARTAKEVDNAKKFAVQGFAKSILDVADNLERAMGAVPADATAGGAELDKEKLQKLLKGLLEGVQATEKVLLHVFKMNGIEQYNPVGQKFDPNLHNALYEMPDGSKEPGTVAAVSKRGYKLHERVIRPADVGVVRAP